MEVPVTDDRRRTVPRLSIGLPVYNGEGLLPESIDALLGQSFTDFELIISDNASTDRTAEICRRYAEQDSRVRYIRQRANIGMVPNHNFLVGVARGEFFKWASYDDLYARDFLQRCVEALDAHPGAVLAHAWCVLLDAAGESVQFFKNPDGSASSRAPDRFRSMLFDGKGDWTYAVFRTSVLRQTPLHGSYHGGDRTLITEFALHGALYQVKDWMFFRRDHPDRHLSTREWSAVFDPRRASRLRNPAIRLYTEYLWAYVSAVYRSPLTHAEKRECYSHFLRWLASRAFPCQTNSEGEASLCTQPWVYLLRRLSRLVLRTRVRPAVTEATAGQVAPPPGIQVGALVPSRERESL
jgi:glycosyltransferase involved in cell wall biosynthesis